MGRRILLAWLTVAALAGTALADANVRRTAPIAVPPAPAQTHLRPAGPVADFEPIAALVAHALVVELDPAFDRLLRELLGSRYYVETVDPCGTDAGRDCEHWPADRMTLWARDYVPAFVRRADGRLKVVRYLSQNPNRTFYLQTVAPRQRHPLQHSLTPNATRPAALLETLPLIHENGNLVTNGTSLFLTARVLQENTIPPPDPHLPSLGFKRRSPDEIVATLARVFERPASDVIILPTLPGERTGHIDLFLMAVDRRTLLVPAVPPEALGHAVGPREQQLGITTALFLDRTAESLKALGFEVARLPMVAPVLTASIDGVESHIDPLHISPTNTLLLRTDQRAVAVLPSFAVAGRTAAFVAMQKRFEKQWAEFFRARGWETRLLDATPLARRGGLFRCVTAPIPK